MYLQLRGSFDFTPTLEGVGFKALVLPDQLKRVTLRGAHFYKLAEKICPRLDGATSWQHVLDELSQEEQPLAENLRTFLLEQGMLREVSGERANPLSPAERQQFGTQLNYLNCFRSEAGWYFEQFRATRCWLTGNGLLAQSAARSLWENGLRCLVTSSATYAELLPVLEEIQVAYPTASLEIADDLALANCQMALYAASIPDRLALQEITNQCRQAGIPLYPAFLAGQYGYAGCLTLPQLPGCWQCAVHTLEAPGHFGPFVAQLVGYTLAYRVFRYRTALTSPENRTLYRLDLETLAQTQQPLRFCNDCELQVANYSLN